MSARGLASDLQVCRGALHPRGLRWREVDMGSTNRIWRGSGACGEWFLKWYRQPMSGIHPEGEIASYLHSRGFTGVPEFGGELRRKAEAGEWASVAFAQRWVEGRTAWDVVVESLRGGTPDFRRAEQIGRAVGALHRELASGGASGAFGCEPWGEADGVDWLARLESSAEALLCSLAKPCPDPAAMGNWQVARRLWVEGEFRWRARIREISARKVQGNCSRVHGDLHLGQMLLPSGGGVLFVDFEGEPLRPLAERRAKDLPLRDVAGMWRSFAYASAVAGAGAEFVSGLQEAFLQGWLELMQPPAGDWRGLLEALVWEKAVYETRYEIAHRPAFLGIPLMALEDSLAGGG